MAVSCNLTAYEVANSMNIANNTTNVYVKLTYTSTSTSHNFNNPPGSITINGTTYNFNHNINYNTTEILFEKTITVTHNNDGTKGISITYNFNTGISAGNITGDRWLNLSTVPRTSSVSCDSGNIGSSVKININRASSSFTHTLSYNFGGLTGTIATRTSDTSINWTIPTSFYAKIPNAKSGKGTITCETYSGDTKVGTSTCNFTASVTNSAPTITATIVDTNAATKALTGDENKLVKYYSNAKVTITATAKNSATIKSKQLTNGYNNIYDKDTVTINNVENNVFELYCTDSRGYEATNKITKTMIDYIKLAITQLTIERPVSTENTLNVGLKGNYFNGNFGKVANTLELKWRYKEKSASTYGLYTIVTATKSGNTFSYSGKLGDNFDYQKEYTFEFTVTDKLATYTYAKSTPRGEAIIDIGKNDVIVNGDTAINGDINLPQYKAIKFENEAVLRSNNLSTSLCGQLHSFLQTRKNIVGIREVSKHLNYYETDEFQGAGNFSASRIYDIYVSKILYDNSSGSNGTITLSDSAENYEYLKIIYSADGYTFNSLRLSSPNGKTFNMQVTTYDDGNTNDPGYILTSSTAKISGTSLTKVSNHRMYMYKNDAKPTIDNANNIYIHKVIGYK